ncbi:TPA: outer membrane beta-barrel protein [Legionella pneumophila]|nr:outer membrane beta-barrel protein [Legionella pneumophila]
MSLLKFLVYPLSLGFSVSSFAAQPYLGLQVGSNFFTQKQTITAFDVTGEINRWQSNDGFEGGLLLGVRWVTKPTYLLDAELFASYYADDISVKNTLTGPPFVDHLDQNLGYSFGARILPAYVIRPNLSLFGLLGYIQTQLKSNSLDGVTEGLSGNQSVIFNGVQCGFGINIDFNSGFRLRMQDSYAFYGSRNITTPSIGLDNQLISFNIRPYANQVSLSLIKQFS